MPMFRSNTPGLRIYSADRTRTYKFRAGVFDAEDKQAVEDIEDFAALHPSYGIEQIKDSEGEAQMEAEAAAVAAGLPSTVAEPAPTALGDAAPEPATVEDTPSAPTRVLTDEEAEAMTVPELQEAARQNNLKVGGNRADLVARLTGKEE